MRPCCYGFVSAHCLLLITNSQTFRKLTPPFETMKMTHGGVFRSHFIFFSPQMFTHWCVRPDHWHGPSALHFALPGLDLLNATVCRSVMHKSVEWWSVCCCCFLFAFMCKHAQQQKWRYFSGWRRQSYFCWHSKSFWGFLMTKHSFIYMLFSDFLSPDCFI